MNIVSYVAFALAGLSLASAKPQLVAIIDNDDRAEIEKFSALAPHELDMFYSNIGFISCRFQNKLSRATAVLIDGRNVLTNAHAVIDGDGVSGDCSFALKRKAASPVRVVISRAKLGTRDFNNERLRDWAIAPLTQAIPTAHRVVFDTALPTLRDSLLLVTGVSNTKHLDSTKLIGRRCHVRDDFPSSSTDQSSFLNDCDSEPGDSGGLYFVRKNGNLLAIGLHARGSYADGAYNGQLVGTTVWSFGLAFDGLLGGAISNLSEPKKETALKAEVQIKGVTVRQLTPEDQILYGIPDNVTGALVVSSAAGLREGEVVLEPSIEAMRRTKADLQIKVRMMDGRIENRVLRAVDESQRR